jgi:ketosteroid isomerase-like protein
MDARDVQRLCEDFLSAWNSHDVERVLGVYTDDVVYCDPSTRGKIHGSDGLRRYLTKLFDRWEMSWRARAAYGLATESVSCALLWSATLSRRGSERSVEVNGMDYLAFDGERAARNEVYFDRTTLAPLFEHGEA